MPKITCEDFNKILESEMSWASDLGMRLEHIESGLGTMRLPYHHSSTRPGGTISGPHMMMLADACMYAVVLGLIGPVKLAVTTNFNINFLRKPAETDLLAEGKIIKLGKRLAIMEVSIATDNGGELVAHATGTYSIPPVTVG
ncbi:PaaI family thioesterase [Sedimenticola thiotaurini]|uniref:Thioesterase n=1 Tax=Sedimenticola thiotaurini TaxID=1543721 RepID=A0A0F7JV56_9GAMM|nr:PaaI family thioesterase [Sedimenticola thiotaurini]AKH19447.1 thioesterase [Sedimenticola thiotaurini]